MKKLATLLLAAGLVFSAATGASAIDFKAKGQWVMSFDYGDVGYMDKGRDGKTRPGSNGNDDFSASQRVRLQLDAVASEALSGSVFFEIGNQTWGKAEQGAALGADGTVVEVRRAYLDWVVPQTDLKFRMGLQGIALPAFTNNASQVFDADVAGITASYKFNDNVATTLFWARPFNDNYTTAGMNRGTGPANFLDNMDMFALLVPMTFDGVKVTPWVSYAAIGKNVASGENGNSQSNNDRGNNYWNSYTRAGLSPAVNANKLSANSNAYGSAFFAGLTGEITMADPFRFAWDVNYGSYENGVEAQKRQGWYASLLGEYKMDWATPGLYVWYASGDDSNIKNGSERMPSIAADGTDGFSSFASSGNPYIGRENILSSQWTGTWGIGARLKDMSFIEDLKHTFRVNYIGGTNSPSMAKYILGKKDISDPRYGTTVYTYNDFNTRNPTYLTTMDSALEFGLVNTYKVYDNLTLYSEVAYMAMMMDKSDSMWGKGTKTDGSHIRSYQQHDPWNINVSFVYDF